ncbi:ABC transporter permease [Nocardioides sp. CER19]|uniref:sugar ABC transporter permease n=1 Tax=Nocardioides sp. CER19 TaxID=3038538 RepID=UPI00244BA84B|nr:ABC transporter permease [Nocardioides sp. CER19]MDH2413628.1 ABC transporter permease [Nocardioides sp. CER19]
MTVDSNDTTPTPRPTGGSLADTDFAGDNRQAATLGDALRDYRNRVRGGDIGSLPAILGLVVLFIIFSFANDKFLSTLNLANLITQSGSICVLAMGLVFVLLLGEIDLSAGVAGGVAASITGLMMTDHGQPWYFGVIIGIAAGAVIGLVIGTLVSKLGIPSFVVTLAFFLALQGVILKLIGQGGAIGIDDNVIRGMTIKNVPVTLGWILAVLLVLVFAGISLNRHRVQVAKNLAHDPFVLVIIKIVVFAAIILGVTALLNANRSLNPVFPIEGIPWVLPVVAVLLIFWTFVLTRTSYGRHLYAVGGNAEAARRAGINVGLMKISAFVIASSMAAVSGIMAASYAGKVSPSSGGGNTLLYAVAAAVIGGTSLFGGRGRAVDAVIGGVVIATIANGLGLLNQAAYINFLVTGGVLLLAASVDAISRRRRSASGV